LAKKPEVSCKTISSKIKYPKDKGIIQGIDSDTKEHWKLILNNKTNMKPGKDKNISKTDETKPRRKRSRIFCSDGKSKNISHTKK